MCLSFLTYLSISSQPGSDHRLNTRYAVIGFFNLLEKKHLEASRSLHCILLGNILQCRRAFKIGLLPVAQLVSLESVYNFAAVKYHFILRL